MILDEAVYMLNKLIMTLCRSHADTGMHVVMALGSVEAVGRRRGDRLEFQLLSAAALSSLSHGPAPRTALSLASRSAVDA
jgi:hypothetical protein